MKLQNTHSEYRVWTDLQTTEGRTLGLGPGEVGDVAIDQAPLDPWLKPVKGPGPGKRSKPVSGRGAGPQTPSSGDSPPDDPKTEPAEADASGKEDGQ